MHFIALHKDLVFFICLSGAKTINVLLQIPAQVFIHDREKEEEFLIHTLLFNNKYAQFRKQRGVLGIYTMNVFML